MKASALSLDRRDYDAADVEAAALSVGGKARVRASKRAFLVEVPVALAADFAAEALMQAYRRQALAAFGDAAAAALAGALGRGLAPEPADPLEQLEPQVAADRAKETAELLVAARSLE